jgi:hypothetical protein
MRARARAKKQRGVLALPQKEFCSQKKTTGGFGFSPETTLSLVCLVQCV